jgi:hypothetical protein
MREASEIQVGDVVRVHYGSRFLEAEVLEDRGPLGVGGEHLVRVGWVPSGAEDRIEFEVRASEVSPKDASFETVVGSLLRRLRVEVDADPPKVGGWQPDFVVSLPTGPLLLEAKSFPEGAAPRTVSEVERQLRDASAAYGAREAAIVVPGWDRFLMRRAEKEGVSIVPFGELEEWLTAKLAA